MTDDEEDVPIRVDFRDPETARTWVEETRLKKPFRPSFFAAFCAALSSRRQARILELGSGPGQLAREILLRCDVREYVALDWSQAMHDIAAAHLGDLARRVTFVVRDFREPSWPESLGVFDVIVTMQAAHETRHKRHVVPLFERARTLLGAGGLMLYCDGYLHAETKLPALSFERAEQPRALERAGFVDVRLLHDEGHQALYSATNPAMTFDEALADPARKVQASRDGDEGQRVVTIYRLASHGAKELAAKMVPLAEHDALVADLKARGCEVAETEFHTTVVWVTNANGVEVYDKRRKQFEAVGDRATLVDGTVIERSAIAGLFSWASEDHAHRGIKATLRSGEEVELVTEISLAASGDPTYNRNDLLFDSGWCTTLGRVIANWACTRYENKI